MMMLYWGVIFSNILSWRYYWRVAFCNLLWRYCLSVAWWNLP